MNVKFAPEDLEEEIIIEPVETKDEKTCTWCEAYIEDEEKYEAQNGSFYCYSCYVQNAEDEEYDEDQEYVEEML